MSQFATVSLVAQSTSLTIAGHYFSYFGIITVTYIMSGLGIPDALVKKLPAMSTSSAERKNLIWQTISLSSVTNLVIALFAFSITLAISGQLSLALTLATWWLAYAQVFLFSQVLVALGVLSWGLFGAYTVINLGYLIFLVPYLLLSRSSTLSGLLIAATLGALAGSLFLALRLRKEIVHAYADAKASSDTFSSAWVSVFPPSVRTGLPLALSRLLQGLLPWAPVWLLTLSGEAEGAAIYAGASRLAVAVTAILGSLRFASRPNIVGLAAESNWSAIVQMSRRSSYISAAGAFGAMGIIILFGDGVVNLVLGAGYKESSSVLLILLVAILAEAFGGLSDEILKMMSMAWVVLGTLALAAGLQALLLLGARDSPITAAWTTVCAFALQYFLQIMWLAARTPVSIWPKLTPRLGPGRSLH